MRMPDEKWFVWLWRVTLVALLFWACLELNQIRASMYTGESMDRERSMERLFEDVEALRKKTSPRSESVPLCGGWNEPPC